MHAALDQYKLKIGDKAPTFDGLQGVDGKTYDLDAFQQAKALVLVWHCNHCPYANAFEGRINEIARDYGPKGVGLLAISSNDAEEYPEDSFENMRQRAEAGKVKFPYAFDETQEVAEAYGALCTPHVFLFDGERALAYQGRIDAEKDDPAKGGGRDLRDALDDVLAGREVRTPLTPAFGCSIKWGPAHFERVKP